jgi:2-keto-4-pentenoate hydratase
VTTDDLVEFVLASDTWAEPHIDLLSKKPDLTIPDAYALQVESMQKRVEHGDRIVGYKAAGTSRSARAVLPDMSFPVVGTLLQSNLAHDGAVFAIRPGSTFVEAEIAVVLGSDLQGRDVNALDVAQAVSALCPGIEIAPWSPTTLAKERSEQHAIATQKTDGLIVLGTPRRVDPGIDLRFEAAVMEVDGEYVASGAGVEAMGHPYNVVASIARHLAQFDRGLTAGMVVMTGCLIPALTVQPGTAAARATFSSLGSVGLRFTTEGQSS